MPARTRNIFPAAIVASVALLALAVTSLPADEPTDEPQRLPTRTLPRDNLLLFEDQQGVAQPVKSRDDWLRRKQGTRQAIEAIFGSLPGDDKRCPLDMQIEEEVDRGAYLQRRITYASEPGGRVPAYLLIPKRALEPNAARTPAVLCLHPTHQDGGRLVIGEATKANRQYGQELAERGYVVLAPYYPLLGEYQPDLKKLGWQSGSLKAVWDNIRGLDLLDSLPFVKPGRYVAVGHSLGGHNSVFTAYFDERIQGVVTSCGLDSFVDYYGGSPAVWQPERGWTQTRYIPKLGAYRGRLHEIPFDYHEIVASLAPRSVLIVAPLKDDNFRADSVDRVAQAARPVFELYDARDKLQVEHPEGGHDFPPAMRDKAYQLIDALLRE